MAENDFLKKISKPIPKEEFESKKNEKPDVLREIGPDGNEIIFDLDELKAYWGDFFSKKKFSWEDKPEKIRLSAQDEQEARRLMRRGFDEMMIIPADFGVTEQEQGFGKSEDTSGLEGYIKVRSKLEYRKLKDLVKPKGIKELKVFEERGGLESLEDDPSIPSGNRAVLTKGTSEIGDDPLLSPTLNHPSDKLRAINSDAEVLGLRPMTVAEYMLLQGSYLDRFDKPIDKEGCTALPATKLKGSEDIPFMGWSERNDSFYVGANRPETAHPQLGTRYVKSFNLISEKPKIKKLDLKKILKNNQPKENLPKEQKE